MSYYTGNDVYRRLEEINDPRFLWTSGSAWFLIYGDRYSHEKAVVFVTAKSIINKHPEIIERAKNSWTLAGSLADRTGLPFFDIRYEDRFGKIDSVTLDKTPISLEELKNRFEKIGLEVERGSTGKAINSQESSTYHQWQRDNLGSTSTVSDIDLLILNDSLSTPIEIVELKRSRLRIEDWSPFRKDFPGLNLIANMAHRINARFTITYNYHVKEPVYIDDASSMSLFECSSTIENARHLGIFTFDEFVAGDYLQDKGQR